MLCNQSDFLVIFGLVPLITFVFSFSLILILFKLKLKKA